MEGREVLAISPLYFDLTSGIDRFLYRLARRHAGNGLDNPEGWIFTFKDLHKRSGSPAPFGQFSRDLRWQSRRDGLPTYTMFEEKGRQWTGVRLEWRRLLL